MSRRSRSGVVDTEEEASRMSQAEMEQEIHRCKHGYESGGTSQARKAFFKRLVWLERQREVLFDVPAPYRKFSTR